MDTTASRTFLTATAVDIALKLAAAVACQPVGPVTAVRPCTHTDPCGQVDFDSNAT